MSTLSFYWFLLRKLQINILRVNSTTSQSRFRFRRITNTRFPLRLTKNSGLLQFSFIVNWNHFFTCFNVHSSAAVSKIYQSKIHALNFWSRLRMESNSTFCEARAVGKFYVKNRKRNGSDQKS